MRRVPVEKRPNATRLVQSQGLVYTKEPTAENPADPYWPDDRYYSFTNEEITLIEKAGKDVFDMCCEAANYLVEDPDVITSKMAIPAYALKQIKKSWEREPVWGSIYGRFDVCFGGLDHPDPRLRVPKFYEFNADTPTSLVEAASIQWFWLEQTGHGQDQFNSLTEKLIEAWKRNLTLIEENLGHRVTVHFAVAKEVSGEEAMNTTLLMDACQQAGWLTKTLFVDQISISPDGRFFDQFGEHIDVVFKLYPWEFMVEEEFGEACFRDMETIGQRNEAGQYTLFAILWKLFENDPRSRWLLPTYFEDEAPASLTKFARKPIFAREGADILLQADGQTIQDSSGGYYGKEGYIVQELALLPEFRNKQDVTYYPVVGLWFVDGEPAGIGIREDITPITTNGSWFVPHSISDGPCGYERQPVPDEAEIEASLMLEKYMEENNRGGDGVLNYIASVVN
ncbi:hypothetical protein M426DRAFT_56688 [Hypoxylon sp. CI-4A]|nr:hypothetical protein M426DRAFT_56688 [Hypoxylon sp. CI-4A]